VGFQSLLLIGFLFRAKKTNRRLIWPILVKQKRGKLENVRGKSDRKGEARHRERKRERGREGGARGR